MCIRDRLQHVGDTAAHFSGRSADDPHGKGHVLVHGLLGNQAEILEHNAQAAPQEGHLTGANGVQIITIHHQTATGDGFFCGQQAEDGALTLSLIHIWVLTATEDRRQKTVLDLLPPEYQNLFPVGRLDKDTEGLLLLTDDGALAHRLLSPRHHVDKVYLAEIDGEVDASDVAAFEAGMTLGDGTQCLPAGLESLGKGRCRVTLREGKFHQVKRMLAQRGKPVLHLKRLSMGDLQLDSALKVGEFRLLTVQEVQNLKK